MKKSLFLIFWIAERMLIGQESPFLTSFQTNLNQARALYEKGGFSASYYLTQQILSQPIPPNNPHWPGAEDEAKRIFLLSALSLERPDAGQQVSQYLAEKGGAPESRPLVLALADFYFDRKDYAQALVYFRKLAVGPGQDEARDDIPFRTGYSYFALEKWKESIPPLKKASSQSGTRYVSPANYYLATAYYRENLLSDALATYRSIEKTESYRHFVPFHIAQILFVQDQYDEVIRYAVPRYEDNQTRNRRELGQLIGQSHFEKKDFKQALPYLEEYAEGNSKLRDEENYQLGFCLYHSGAYARAIEYLLPLSDAHSTLGQNALFYLADCYLKTQQNQDALLALSAAANLPFDPVLQQEATFQHGKLAFSMRLDREALQDLQQIPSSSSHYNEAQAILNKVLLSFRDFQEAIRILTDLQKKAGGTGLREAHQTIYLNLGIQQYQKKEYRQARLSINRSLEEPFKQDLAAVGLFWLADIANREKQYGESISLLNQYFSKPPIRKPEEASIPAAYYLQGYNLLRSGKGDLAIGQFQRTADFLEANPRHFLRTEVQQRLLGDAILQLANLYLSAKNYDRAGNLYNEIIRRNFAAIDYALYQKALLEGFKGNISGEISLLESLVSKYPRSGLADDALLLIGQVSQGIQDFDKAIQAYERLVTQYANASDKICEGFNGMGTAHYNAGKYQESIRHFKKVFSLNCTAEDKNLALSGLEDVYLNKLNQPEEYISFKASIPGYAVDAGERESIAIRAADLRFDQLDYRGAVEGYSNYLKQFPSGTHSAKAYFFRAESYIKLQNYTLAAQDYEANASQHPNPYSIRATEKAALTYFNLKNYAKSWPNFRLMEARVTEEDKKIEAQMKIIQCSYHLREKMLMQEYWEKIQKNPVIATQEKDEANYLFGKYLYEVKEYAQAIVILDPLSRQNASDFRDEVNFLIGSYYLIQKDFSRAEQYSAAGFQEYLNAYWAARSGLVYVDTQIEIRKYVKAKIILQQLEIDFGTEEGMAVEIQIRKETLRKLEGTQNR